MTRRDLFTFMIAVGTWMCLTVSAERTNTQGAPMSERVPSRSSASVIVPPDLATLVRNTDAAVVATVSAIGNPESKDDFNPQGKLLATDTVIPYQLHVSEVLYNKAQAVAPPLEPATEIAVTEYLYGEPTTRSQSPAAPGDQYVLFLWHRKSSNEWSLLQWPFQFRRVVAGGSALAVPVESLRSGTSLLNEKWLGSPIELRPFRGAQTAPSWASFVEGVRRLGMTKASR